MSERLAKRIAEGTPVASHRPWPRYEVDQAGWTGAAQALGEGGGDLLGLWGETDFVHLALRVTGAAAPCVLSYRVKTSDFPSVGRYHAPALRLERAVCDLYGHLPFGSPDRRAWLDHGAWGLRAPLGPRTPSLRRDPAAYDFLPALGEGLHQIPVGPVHAGIIEPGHFRFSVNGEIVARLEERLGYVHKGIDGLLTGTDIERASRVVARISGDSTVAYSFAFARAVEEALQIDPPPRAKILRGVMAEIERIANHLGDIGAICNDASFSLIHAHCGIFRERVLAAADRAFGHRLMMDRIVPGGVKDTGPGAGRGLQVMLDEIEKPFAEIVRLYDDTPSLQDRTCNTGIVSKALVDTWAAGGHVGRASGRDFDTRRDLPYAPYHDAAFAVPVFTAGDVDARVWVRIREIEQSMLLLRHWLANLPPGPARVDLRDGSGEGIAMTEAFRGDVLVWVRVEGGRIAKAHARDASWFQWPLLEAAIENNIVADFPLCNKSFNCSYSGHDL
ncbi:MAG: hydrogenase expression protein HypE [Xanthobacteraceae bacterium]|nr:hydrogenase expression protein HypE [Xanthobacteraceae bacterium]